MNDRTGNTILLDHPVDVTTPNGKDNTNRLILDKAGLYKLPDRTIAVNLLNAQESDVNPREIVGSSADAVKLTAVREKRRVAWEYVLIIGALVILFVELFYIKIRGDV